MIRAVRQAAPPVPILRVPGWESIPQLEHGFCGRRGGSSRGPFAELNLSLSVGDAADAVQENWRRVHDTTGGALRFLGMRQVHGERVIVVDAQTEHAGDGDAIVTAAQGVGLSVLTADCVPILLVAPRQRVIAAVHAGWRGTVAGIACRAVEQLQREFGVDPADTYAGLGPAIGVYCYEVERGITDELQRRWGALPEAVRPAARGGRDGNPAKAWLDLRRANARILAQAGIRPDRIVTVGPCTACAPTEYFSYRAAGRAPGGSATGRQLSFIGWSE